jgi:uncharacterized membrane protein YeiB
VQKLEVGCRSELGAAAQNAEAKSQKSEVDQMHQVVCTCFYNHHVLKMFSFSF